MKNGLSWLATALITAAVASSACGGDKSTTPKGGSEAAGGGGEPALVITDAAEWSSLVDQGKTSFDRACGSCHPGGEADLGPALKGHPESSADMTRQIREGSGLMKPIGQDKLPDDQLKAVLVYLSTIGAVNDVKGP